MIQDKKIRLAGIAYESLVNGTGIRRVIFAQGCKHNCPSCFNPETHSFEGGDLMDMDILLQDIKANPMLKGVTFSGGDPFEQAEEFAYLGENIKSYGLSLWSYTGYSYEYIIENLDLRKGWRKLITNIDVLIDGRFEIDKKDESLKFRGSSNQRIIDVKESLKVDRVITIAEYDKK